jgi:predicted house-cleaning noncanonical NTP pyrophosphatase (MazG superfamily)
MAYRILDPSELPKLIRDNIPEITMESEGKTIICHTLNEKDFLEYIFQKLTEEVKECQESKNEEDELKKELADLYEGIDSILDLKNIDKAEILEIQTQKRLKNGGFKKRLLMTGKI